MNKTFSNLELDKKLIPRLRFIGFSLLFFAVCSLSYSLISTPYLSTTVIEDDPLVKEGEEQAAGFPELTDSPPFMVTEKDKLNLHLVTAVFCIVGTSCLYLAAKKKKILDIQLKTPPEEGA